MDRANLIGLISATVKDFALSATGKELENLDEETRLIGSKSVLDSFGMVSVVLDVEQQVNDELGLTLSLADERAMSQKQSPFRSIGTLADYVLLLIQEQ